MKFVKTFMSRAENHKRMSVILSLHHFLSDFQGPPVIPCCRMKSQVHSAFCFPGPQIIKTFFFFWTPGRQTVLNPLSYNIDAALFQIALICCTDLI